MSNVDIKYGCVCWLEFMKETRLFYFFKLAVCICIYIYIYITMAIGQRPRVASGILTINCEASQFVTVRPCLPSWYAAKNDTTGSSRMSSQRKTAQIMEEQHRGQASHCRCWCTWQKAEVDGQPSWQRRLSQYTNDAQASREFSLLDKECESWIMHKLPNELGLIATFFLYIMV